MHQLKVTLNGVRPPVWRRIVVSSETTLGELAAILEAAMGWYGTHLHQFEQTDGTIYGMPAPDLDLAGLDENRYQLGDVLPEIADRMSWIYDFGDGWEHTVVVEAVTEPDPDTGYPLCVKGARACPPEDCGGPWGYANLLEVLADPTHPDHEDMLEWVGGEFDPDAFDANETGKAMLSPRPVHGWF